MYEFCDALAQNHLHCLDHHLPVSIPHNRDELLQLAAACVVVARNLGPATADSVSGDQWRILDAFADQTTAAANLGHDSLESREFEIVSVDGQKLVQIL